MTDTVPAPAELVDALRGPSPNYKRSEMDRALARLDECEPALLALLREAAEDPGRFDEREGPSRFALIYALHLLARRGSKAAHEPLLAFLRQPPEIVDCLLGGAITEDLGVWLYATAAGRSSGLEGLVLDPSGEEWSRSAAVDALVMLADHDPALSSGIVEFLRALLSDPEIPDAEPLLSMVVSGLITLGDTASADMLRRCVEELRIDPFWIRAESIDPGLASSGPRGAYCERQLARYLPEGDRHRSLAGWAAFEENRNRPSYRPTARPGSDRKAVAKKAGAKSKARRKAQKKARRKQRKRR